MTDYQVNGGHPLFIDSKAANKGRRDSFDISPTTRRSSTSILRDASNKAKHELSSPHHALIEDDINNVDGFLDYIAHLRLRYMPCSGSKWDRVLQWAEFFASAMHHFQLAGKSLTACNDEASQLIWSSCHVLLELGKQRLDMTHRAFALFNDAGLMFAHFSENKELFATSPDLRQSLEGVYADLVSLVVDVSLHYANGGGISEFDARFAHRAEMLFSYKESIIEAFWREQLQALHGREVMAEIEEIRRFLSPHDTVVRGLLSRQSKSRSHYVEYTCEWFDHMLQEFTAGDDNVFLITGKPGCGKTVLSQWIMERLRRQQDRASYDVACFFIEGDFKTETTSMSIARDLLRQVFDGSVGDVDLFEQILALKQRPAQDNMAMEQAMWAAIEGAIKRKRTVLIVDGLDKVTGGVDSSVRILDQLHQVTSKSSGAKAIVLSQPLKKPGSHHARLFNIDTRHVYQDMERVLDGVVASSYPSLTDYEKANLVQRLVTLGDGSFTHSMLLLEMTKREKTLAGIMSSLDSIPRTMHDCVKKLMGTVDMHNRDTRITVAWLLAAQRPLTIREIKTLMAVDTSQLTSSPRISDAENDLRSAMGPLIRIEDGVVRFRFPLIHQQLLEMAMSTSKDSRLPFNLQEANYDMVTRCLADVKMSVMEHTSPSMERMPSDVMERMFVSHNLLEYTARYWPIHFMQSPMYQKDGKHKLTSEFKYVFPSSTTLALIEHTCWTTEMMPHFKLALHLRKTITPDHEDAIFQTLVSLAGSCQMMSNTKEASTYFFDAFRLGVKLFGKQSSVVATVVAGYIDSTQPSKENMTVREELLDYLVAYQKQTRGASAQQTIKYARLLIQLYKESNKMNRALELEEELHQMCIEHYGMHHPSTQQVLEGLMTTLHESGNTEQLRRLRVAQYERARRSLSLSDAALVRAARDMVSFYEKNSQVNKAEEILTELWQSLTQACQSRTSLALQERKLEVAMAYQKFLDRNGRPQDAQNVLVGVWTEYQDALDQETIQTRLSKSQLTAILAVGRELQQHRLLEAAKNVFSSMWSYLRRVNEQESSLAIETATSLSSVSRELIEMQASNTTAVSTGGGSDISAESIDEFEEMLASIASITKSMTTTSSASTSKKEQKASSSAATSLVTTAGTLSAIYVSQHRWRQATSTCIKALEIAWPSVLATDGSSSKAELPVNDKERAIAIATAKRLALCYFTQRQIGQAEHIHARVYQATKVLGVRDERFLRAAHELIDFYDTVFRFDGAVGVLVELQAMQKAELSAANAVTVHTSYRLAKSCRLMQRDEEAERYFGEIVKALSKSADDKVLEREAIEAAMELCSMHVEARRWGEAGKLYTKLWKTVMTQSGAGYGWTPEQVEGLYVAYFDLLETKLKVDFKMSLQMTTEYQKRVVELFGEDNEVSIKATLQLAELLERSDEHSERAVSLYEKALSSSEKTKVAQRTLKALTQYRQRLAHLYSKQTRTSSKGLTIYRQEIEKTAATYGFASSQAMRQLSELVASCAISEAKENRTQAIELLRTAIRDIVVKERSAEKQVDAAHSIVRMYVRLEARQTAVELLANIRRQIVSGEYGSGTLNLQGAGQHSFAFVVAMEEALAEGKHHFSELMATLMTERLLHQNYTRSVNTNVSFEILFSHGARLVSFYTQHGRGDESKQTEADLLQRFARVFEAQASSHVFQTFFHTCLHEMGGSGGDRDQAVITTATAAVLEHLQAARFAEAFELAGFVHRFLQLYGAFDNQENVSMAFKLALWLGGRGNEVRTLKTQCGDKKLREKMNELSAAFLRLAIQRLDVRITDMPLADLNELVGLLGEQRNWEALESILSAAWSSRHSAAPWPAHTVVALGARLVQVRFQLPGCRSQALHLAADIAYNLRRTWGLHDQATLDMLHLLADLYSLAGENNNALEVRQSVIRGTLEAIEHGAVEKNEGAAIAAREFELLRRTHSACGGWNPGDVATFGGMQVRLKELLSGQQKWMGCKDAQEGVEGWKVPKGKDPKRAELEKASIPESWEFLGKEETAKHRNNLRRTSGLETARPPATMLYGGAAGGKAAMPSTIKHPPRKLKTQQQRRDSKGDEKKQKIDKDQDFVVMALEAGPIGVPIGQF
ncbi:hypothetical protein DIS24_g1763 [Lasiodiplodia hormozganensis]|uniref:AAA+ ATPase domain-containing protein n=1 Tax=Lasiodiplodia hormozganensis TaxID=869390 RepID=A0AA39Z2A6_9PEZI|nr:hypothetical protein DIS24_g1763 [Lasiodiplodia hormozganensis]